MLVNTLQRHLVCVIKGMLANLPYYKQNKTRKANLLRKISNRIPKPNMCLWTLLYIDEIDLPFLIQNPTIISEFIFYVKYVRSGIKHEIPS